MNDFYKDMQAIASGLLAEFKQGDVRYIHLTPGTGPVDRPGKPVETPYVVDAAARGVQQRYVDNSNIVQSDMQVTMAVKPGVVPQMSGFIEGDGVRYKIVGVQQKPPFGVPVAHVIIFRK